jgi:hypothetical protein
MKGEMDQAFRRISHSLPEMAVITGVLTRVLHMLFNAHGDQIDWHVLVGTFVVVPVTILALATLYLANYPVRQWVWRAPVFAVAETAAEGVTSLILIAVGRERWGTGRAEFGDWPAMTAVTLSWRLVTVCLFAFILGAIVQWVRRKEFAAERHHGPPSHMS